MFNINLVHKIIYIQYYLLELHLWEVNRLESDNWGTISVGFTVVHSLLYPRKVFMNLIMFKFQLMIYLRAGLIIDTCLIPIRWLKTCVRSEEYSCCTSLTGFKKTAQQKSVITLKYWFFKYCSLFFWQKTA